MPTDLPNFVRPNESAINESAIQQTPTITADTTQPTIPYYITADDTTQGGTHSFKTILSGANVVNVGGEVVIYGKNTDGKWAAFVSRCRNPNPNKDPKDWDVDWFPAPPP